VRVDGHIQEKPMIRSVMTLLIVTFVGGEPRAEPTSTAAPKIYRDPEASWLNWPFLVSFQPNGELLTAHSCGRLYRWNPRVSGQLVKEQRTNAWARAGVATKDGRRVAVTNGVARVWLGNEGAFVELATDEAEVSAMAFSSDGSMLLTGAYDGTVRVFDGRSGRLLRKERPCSDPIKAVSFDANGDGVFVATANTLKHLDSSVKNELGTVSTPKAYEVRCASWLSARNVLLVGCGKFGPVEKPDPFLTIRKIEGGELFAWNPTTSKLDPIGMANKEPIRCIQVSPNGDLLVSGCDDGVVAIWDANDFAMRRKMQMCKEGINSLAFSRDGKLLAVSSLDGIARVWDVDDLLRRE
jgi:WD40 repeat protein